MKPYFIVIGVAAVLIVLLGSVAVRKDGQLSGAVNLLSAEKARSTELQNKVESLEQEVTALKETADYYFQKGVDQQSAGNFQDAKTAFEAVVAKFPTSNLVGSAHQRLTAVNEAIAKADADRLAQMQRQQEEQEKLAQEQGEPIEYTVFYGRANNGSLPIGKRFRFRAKVFHNLALFKPEDGDNLDLQLYGIDAAFDDEAQYERFLQGPDKQTRTIVASKGSDGRFKIHGIE